LRVGGRPQRKGLISTGIKKKIKKPRGVWAVEEKGIWLWQGRLFFCMKERGEGPGRRDRGKREGSREGVRTYKKGTLFVRPSREKGHVSSGIEEGRMSQWFLEELKPVRHQRRAKEKKCFCA